MTTSLLIIATTSLVGVYAINREMGNAITTSIAISLGVQAAAVAIYVGSVIVMGLA